METFGIFMAFTLIFGLGICAGLIFRDFGKRMSEPEWTGRFIVYIIILVAAFSISMTILKHFNYFK